jgi:exodeoxyribonuclease VII small subunit
MSRKTQKINFESAIAELEKLVEKMEDGEFSLEESLKQFENGIALARSCQQALREAEQKVFQLTQDEQRPARLTPFEPSEES